MFIFSVLEDSSGHGGVGCFNVVECKLYVHFLYYLRENT